MSVQIIADQIYFRGYLVGVLVQTGTPASFLSDFVYELENGTLHEVEEVDLEPQVIVTGGDYEDALDELMTLAQIRAQGGLLRVSDLANMIALLKEQA